MIFFTLLFFALAYADVSKDNISLDALLGRVAQEPVLRSDLRRYKDILSVLECSGLRMKSNLLLSSEKALFEAYVDEELMYFDAKNKLNSAGMISEAVTTIHKLPTCKRMWQDLGEKYNKLWFTKARPKEGQSILVRELERRLVVDKFRKTEIIADGELWKREARSRYTIKLYLE